MSKNTASKNSEVRTSWVRQPETADRRRHQANQSVSSQTTISFGGSATGNGQKCIRRPPRDFLRSQAEGISGVGTWQP